MSDIKSLDNYYSLVDKNLMDNMYKNNNLRNLLNLSTKSELYIFNKKNKKWQLKSKDKLLKENDKVLDIGGNDGTLLNSFLQKKPYLNFANSANGDIITSNTFTQNSIISSVQTRPSPNTAGPDDEFGFAETITYF